MIALSESLTATYSNRHIGKPPPTPRHTFFRKQKDWVFHSLHHSNPPSHTKDYFTGSTYKHCMSHTPTTTAPSGTLGATAQQDKDKKPSLTGVRIKQRKGQAKAQSKFEPEGEWDGLLEVSTTEQKTGLTHVSSLRFDPTY